MRRSTSVAITSFISCVPTTARSLASLFDGLTHRLRIGVTERRYAKRRTEVLFDTGRSAASMLTERSSTPVGPALLQTAQRQDPLSKGKLAYWLYQAGLGISPALFLATCFAFGALAVATLSNIVNSYLLPLFFLGGALIPWIYIDGRLRLRAHAFAVDYPTVLLATASSIKTGMTPYQALERSTKLLPSDSPVRLETERLLSALRRGDRKEQAVATFAQDIALPELDLFRSAFLLVLEAGGRFGPTLERLSGVSKDRATLIENARVSTATMRMTANVLLLLTPFVVGSVAIRTPEFFTLITSHPIANVMASVGVLLIVGCYIVLWKMSNFKP